MTTRTALHSGRASSGSKATGEGGAAKPGVDQVLVLETPFGKPVTWAEVAMASDIGDSHDLNDDRCLVVTCKDLGEQAPAPFREFMLCLLADGATGSTFSPGVTSNGSSDDSRQAGWRASQLAQAAFVERFLTSSEVDILDRLKDGLRAADRALVDSGEGTLSSTLTALFLSADGTACAASIGDSVLLVFPPKRKTPGDRRLKKLGYEDSTAVGSGDTTLRLIDENELIEQWWPNKEGGRTSTRVEPGTYFVLLSDGISDNLPAEFIDEIVHRHSLDRATLGLPLHTRDRRMQTQKRGGGSTNELGLDNMSAIVVRFDGGRRLNRPAHVARLDDASLVCALGTHGGPTPDAGGQFGLICVAGQSQGATAAPGFLRAFIEADQHSATQERLTTAFLKAMPSRGQVRFAALTRDESGESYTFSFDPGGAHVDFDPGGAHVEPGGAHSERGGARVEPGGVVLSLDPGNTGLPVRIAQRQVSPARDNALQRFIYTPVIWASSLAGLAVFLLLGTAFATGTIRPAPPPVPTPRPGEPTPTPDTRPAISIGGIQLVAPAPPATPTPAPRAVAPVQAVEPSAPLILNDQALPQEPSVEVAPQAPRPSACTNLLGIGCRAPPPVSRRPAAPAQPEPSPADDVASALPAEDTILADQPLPCTNLLGIGCPSPPPADPPPPAVPVLPVPSPAALVGSSDTGPRPGSDLELALRVASLASDQFNRSLVAPVPEPAPAHD